MSKVSKTEKFVFFLKLDVDALYAEFEFIQKLGLGYEKVDKAVTFLDENKNKHQGSISFSQGRLHCFWDRHPFDWEGFLCPLEKVYEPSLEIYKSSINGAKYAIQDILSTKKFHYLTDGYFCSVECRLAFIEDNMSDPRFINSKILAFEMAGRPCKPAPSWRLLEVYGGSYQIAQFRDLFCNKTFEKEALITKPVYYVYRESFYI